jgi:hypothetical protein
MILVSYFLPACLTSFPRYNVSGNFGVFKLKIDVPTLGCVLDGHFDNTSSTTDMMDIVESREYPLSHCVDTLKVIPYPKSFGILSTREYEVSVKSGIYTRVMTND